MRALLVSYAFPPVGGAGVARMLKLAKYLPLHGIEPAVLTVQNPSVPVHDESLARDIAPALEILRARTLEPGYGLKRAAWGAAAAAGLAAGGSKDASLRRSPLARAVGAASWLVRQALVPDPQLLWQPAAQRALAAHLFAGRGADVVLISGPPFSQFLLAPLARLHPRTRVVLDYRDEWSTYRSSYEMMGALAAALGGPLERLLVRSAHAITTATRAFRDNLLAHFPALDPASVVAIPNGWDPDDFPAALPAPPTDRYVLTYAGTVFRLTSPRGLLAALARLHRAEPQLAARLRVRFLGRIVDTEAALFTGSEALGVERVGYVPHQEVLGELARSHRVLCLLDDVAGAERIYPAKIFELMRLGRPILTLAPPGALADLVGEHRLGEVLPPRDEVAIAALLERELRAFADGHPPPPPAPVGMERYDRRALAGEFAALFRRLASDGVAPG
jgi:glycosyltransferase involved in cell wall biosynthesis